MFSSKIIIKAKRKVVLKVEFHNMEEFKIEFLFNSYSYQASVKQVSNLYYVTLQDAELAQAFGEAMLLEANGDFAWSNPNPDYYRYVLAIENALKKNLGFDIMD